MSALQLFVFIFSIIIATAACVALLLFMLIFPLINRYFDTNLPSYDLFKDGTHGINRGKTPKVKKEKKKKEKHTSTTDNSKKPKKHFSFFKNKKSDSLKKQEQNKGSQNKAQSYSATQDKSLDGKDNTNQQNNLKNSTQTQDMAKDNALNQRTKAVDMHGDVPTIKLPPLEHKIKKEPVLTIAKIDAAVRAEKKRLANINLENVALPETQRDLGTSYTYNNSEYVHTVEITIPIASPPRQVVEPKTQQQLTKTTSRTRQQNSRDMSQQNSKPKQKANPNPTKPIRNSSTSGNIARGQNRNPSMKKNIQKNSQMANNAVVSVNQVPQSKKQLSQKPVYKDDELSAINNKTKL